MTAPTAPAPGYYADPLDPSGERWWDGSAWTETVRPTAPAVDPSPDAPPAVEPDPVALVPALEPDPMPAVSVPAVEPEQVTHVVDQQVPPEVAPSVVPPGLYPDPYGQAPLRWWDGQQWTTQTSQPVPEPGGVPASPTQRAANPASVPGGAGGSTVLPASPLRSHRAAASGRRSIPSGVRFPSRPALAGVSRRFGRKSLAGVLVLVLALGVRVYFLFDHDSPEQPAPAAIASSVNLRAGDLPTAWKVQSGAAADDSDPTGDSFQRDVDRCTGAPDHMASVTYSGVSPTWTRGASQISSDVSVLRTPALAAQDLRAQQGAKGISCVTKVGTPALKRVFAAKGITLAGLTVTRLPGASRDGFALRMKMTLSAHGRTLTVWNDAYGFVRGNVEVSLTQVNTGNVPDRAVAAQALKKLRARSVAAIPSTR